MEDLVIKVKKEDISKFIDTGELSDEEISRIIKQAEGFYRVLATLKITYRLPDYLSVLDTLLFQTEDLAPNFVKSRKFLEYWKNNLDGPIHSVKIYSSRYNPEGQIIYATNVQLLH